MSQKLTAVVICRETLVQLVRLRETLGEREYELGRKQFHVSPPTRNKGPADIFLTDAELRLPLDVFAAEYIEPMVSSLFAATYKYKLSATGPKHVDSMNSCAVECYGGIAMRCIIDYDICYAAYRLRIDVNAE